MSHPNELTVDQAVSLLPERETINVYGEESRCRSLWLRRIALHVIRTAILREVAPKFMRRDGFGLMLVTAEGKTTYLEADESRVVALDQKWPLVKAEDRRHVTVSCAGGIRHKGWIIDEESTSDILVLATAMDGDVPAGLVVIGQDTILLDGVIDVDK